MTPVLVDTNVLLDVATNDPAWGVLVINSLIYAEASVGYERSEDLEAALPADLIRRAPVPYESAFLAGKCFAEYRRRGGGGRSPLPDFYIGAHAAVAGY